MLKEARESTGITQEELAVRLRTKKSAISRIENHAEDVKLSTLEKFASFWGRNIEVVYIADFYPVPLDKLAAR